MKERVISLGVGEMVEFPIEKLNIIRTYAYEVGLKMNRKYKAVVDKARRVITVTREE
jgi:hypothetical protein